MERTQWLSQPKILSSERQREAPALATAGVEVSISSVETSVKVSLCSVVTSFKPSFSVASDTKLSDTLSSPSSPEGVEEVYEVDDVEYVYEVEYVAYIISGISLYIQRNVLNHMSFRLSFNPSL